MKIAQKRAFFARTCSFSPALTAINVSAYDAQTPGVAASARYFGGIGELMQVWRLCTSGRSRDLGVVAGSSRQSHRLSVSKEDSHASQIQEDGATDRDHVHVCVHIYR